MPIYAVFHAPTRIVRRTTIEADYAVGPTEDKVMITERVSVALTDGPWKLSMDASTLSRPTQQEIDAEQRPYLRPAVQTLVNAMDAILADSTVPTSVKAFFTAYKAMYTERQV